MGDRGDAAGRAALLCVYDELEYALYTSWKLWNWCLDMPCSPICTPAPHMGTGTGTYTSFGSLSRRRRLPRLWLLRLLRLLRRL